MPKFEIYYNFLFYHLNLNKVSEIGFNNLVQFKILKYWHLQDLIVFGQNLAFFFGFSINIQIHFAPVEGWCPYLGGQDKRGSSVFSVK